jgi:hypothetical protein
VATNADSGTATDGDGFTFVSVPTITSINPNSGLNTGGTSITITGTQFASGAAVTVGGAAATNVIVVSSTEITATTPAGTVGPADVVVANGDGGSATDAGGFTFQSTPAITSPDNATFTVGQAGSLTVTASGFPTPVLSETGALPNGVLFDASTGVLSGMPAAGTGGAYALSFSANNGVGSPAVQSFTLTVDQAPAITSANTTQEIVFSQGAFTVLATGFPKPALSITGTLPQGITFDTATGVLGGTPTSPKSFGKFPLTFTASNGVGSNATQSFELNVSGIPAFAVTPNEKYIAQVYLDLLHRVVDEPGMDNWSGQLDAGVAAKEVILEIEECSLNEYQTLVVENLYARYLGRAADPGGLQNWTSFLDGGGTVEGVAANLISSAEYFQKAGNTNDTFLTALYHDVLGRAIDSKGQEFYSGQLAQGVSREAVAFSVLTGQEAYQDAVDSYYEQFLGRPADPNGLNHFVQQLESGSTDQDVIASLLSSPEYMAKA